MDEAVAASREALGKLLEPASIAVIGASSDPGKAGGRPIDYLKKLGFSGRVYPVNPARSEIAGLACYSSLAAIPEVVDLCVITVPGEAVEASLLECAQVGIKAAVVFASGFAEVGGEGAARQQRLADIARLNGIALCGPNCLGLINVLTGAAATFTTALTRSMNLVRAPLGFVSQSGALAASILATMQDNGYGLSHFVTTGNEAALGFADYAGYLISSTDVRVVAGYVEGVDGATLTALARRAIAARKPLVVMKVGSSAAGARASLAHTGNLVGDEAVNRAAFNQLGIVRAETIDELLDYSHAFTLTGPPRGNRVGVVSISGGAGILISDWCERVGLDLAPLSEATRARLSAVLPWFTRAANPLDTSGRPLWDPGILGECIAAIAADEGVDMMLVYVGLATGAADRIAGEIGRAAAAAGKPVLLCWLPEPDPAPQLGLRQAGIPTYPEPVRMVKTAAALAQYGAALTRAEQRAPEGQARSFDFSMLPRHASVAEHAAKTFLAAAGIGAPHEVLAGSIEQAVAAAADIGYPLCLKIVSPDIPHRTEIGAVRLGVTDEDGVREAYAAVTAAARAAAPSARIEGVSVQEMIAGGFELMVSGFHDASFGPVVMVSSGGILVEVLQDSAIRLAPVHRAEALLMLRELRAWRLLEGYRGSPVLDIDAAAAAIVTVSEIVHAASGIFDTIEINPLAVLPKGRGVRALDALITSDTPR